MNYEYLTHAKQLPDLVDAWQSVDFVGIDTEFIRDKSYYPALCLMQIAIADRIFIVDLLSVGKVPEIRNLLLSESIVKIIHACGEDLDALFHHFHVLPVNIFDTQMAAAMLNVGPQVGYGHLVEHYFDIKLAKGFSRTDWLARPLSEEQLAYAAGDVLYLGQIYNLQQAQLQALKIDAFFKADCEEIVNYQRYHPVPENMYLKVKQAFKLNQQELAVLRELAAWRELKARERNLPRGFIIKDAILIDIAKQKPSTLAALAKINSIHAGEVRRYGERLLQCVAIAKAVPSTSWPKAIPRVIDIHNSKTIFGQLKAVAEEVAVRLQIPIYCLANRKLIEAYMMFQSGLYEDMPNQWRGWRKEQLATKFEEILSRH